MKSLFNKLVGGKQEGKVLKVGSHTVQIVRQIAEGGFSYVFLAKDNHNKQYALKRVLTHDEEELQHVQQEAAVMKQLTESDHKNIVKFYDSCVITPKNSDTSEMYILMEYCAGGHLVDIMNSKPQRFSESDILSIFYDVCQAVAHMHSQEPPMAHRDLKVENVLLDDHSGIFKLCDFGSVTTRCIKPSTKHEISAAEDEIQKHTTLQYRAPEMIDLYQHKLISEKVDIWALGCVLYKLAFYKTPFEDSNTLQILNVDYTIPASNYSTKLLNLIRYMLNADPDKRPDIFDVIDEVCKLRNVSSPPRPVRHARPRSTSPTRTPANTTPVHTPVHTPTHSPTASPAQQPRNESKVHDNANNIHATSNATATSNIYNHISPPPVLQTAHSPSSASTHLSPPTILQTSHSGNISKSPAAIERRHRRTASSTAASVSSAAEQLRSRPALTSSSPIIPPPSANAAFLAPPSGVHLHRRGNQGNDNPFASPFISPVVSPSITPSTLSPPLEREEEPERERESSKEKEERREGIDVCVKGAVDSSKSVPDFTFANRLIAITHEQKTSVPILDAIMKQPLTNAFVCLKALSLVHRLMQEGHNQVLVDLQTSAQLYNNLYLGWTKHSDRAPEMSLLLALHALCLYRKIVMHHKTPELDGKISALHNPPSHAYSSLLEIISEVLKIQPYISSALTVCPEDLLSFTLTPLVNEVIYIYNFLYSHLSQEVNDKSVTSPPNSQFSSSFNSLLADLRQFFSSLSQVLPTLASFTTFPVIQVPINPFGETDPFNPFGAPSQFDPFYSPQTEESLPKSPIPSPLKSQVSLTSSSSSFSRTSSLQTFPTYSPPHSPSAANTPSGLSFSPSHSNNLNFNAPSSPSIPRFSVTPASTGGTPLQRSTSLLTASLHINRNFEEMSLDGNAQHQQQLQQQLQQQQLLQQQYQMQQQQQLQQASEIPRPIAAGFSPTHHDHIVLAGNLSPRVRPRDMPAISQPPPARRSAAHRRAQSNTADDIIRRLDPAQLNNIRSASLLGPPNR